MINITNKTIKEAIQPSESMSRRLQRKKNKALNLSYVKYYTCKQKGYYTNKCLKKPKTSSSFGKLHIDDSQESRGRIGISTLYLIFCCLERVNKGLIRFKKRSLFNKLSFCSLVKPQNIKN